MSKYDIIDIMIALNSYDGPRGESSLERVVYLNKLSNEIADVLGLDLEKTRDKLVKNMKEIGMELEEEYASTWLKDKWNRVIL